jgi:hypothetical protein
MAFTEDLQKAKANLTVQKTFAYDKVYAQAKADKNDELVTFKNDMETKLHAQIEDLTAKCNAAVAAKEEEIAAYADEKAKADVATYDAQIADIETLIAKYNF